MSFWDNVERTVKLAGLTVGVITIAGVWYSIHDINTKESDKVIDEWQRSVVYNLIDQNSDIKFAYLSQMYVNEAIKIGTIPRGKIDDLHLRLAILNLIQGNAIVVSQAGGYIAKRELDQFTYMKNTLTSMTTAMQKSQELQDAARAKMTTHLLRIADYVRVNSGKLTEAELRQRITEVPGVDKEFIGKNFTSMIAELLGSTRISEDSEGKLYFGAQIH